MGRGHRPLPGALQCAGKVNGLLLEPATTPVSPRRSLGNRSAPVEMGRLRPALLWSLSLLCGCVSTTSPSSSTSGADTTSPSAGVVSITEEYRPGLKANVFLPTQTGGRLPLVVMIPGGAWLTADPAGFDGLARHLAESGVMAITVTVRAAEDGAVYPAPVEDVLCAVAFGAAKAEAQGSDPGPVAVLGHSSGAHLAALAVLAFDDFVPPCDVPVAAPDGLVGLAGSYDISLIPEVAEPFFGGSPEADPETWRAGNPLLQAGRRPEIPVFLAHGDQDDLVPMAFTTEFGDALRQHGHPTTVSIVTGADHLEIFGAEVSGDLIVDWVLDLAS